MKYLVGSLIISFGILVVVICVLVSMSFEAPDGAMKYLGLAWLLLSIICYPIAKKLVRE